MDQNGIVHVLLFFITLCVFLSGFCLLLFFRNNTRLKESGKQFDVMIRKVQTLEKLFENRDNCTRSHLDKTELKNRMETIPALKSTVPDKYRHVAQLERSGLGAREIAEILDVSQNEAEQMLSLARLSKRD